MLVFDDEIERDLAGGKQPTESEFSYLNRSNRPEAQRVRDALEDWVAHYPEAHRPALIARIRSPIDDQHHSATFELIVHELLLRTGHTVLAVEPDLPDTPNSPDFWVEAPGGVRFYLEVAIATGRSAADRAAEARLAQVVRAIDDTPSPAHYLTLNLSTLPTAPVSLKTLRRQLKTWIHALPEGDAAKDAPPFVYEENGGRFEVGVLQPRAVKADGPHRAVGATFSGVHAAQLGQDIRAVVEKKASRYGDLGEPFVVAVAGFGQHHGLDELFASLIGPLQVTIKTFADGHQEHEEGRAADGVWIGPRGPRKARLSAVLFAETLTAWNLGRRGAVLVRNPWSIRPLPPIPLRVQEWNPNEGEFVPTEGEALAAIFGLSAGWPE